MHNHQKYMRRCLDLAKLGERRVAPNPMVGSVIALNDKIIGEGFHQFFGGPHSEVNAINSVKDQKLLKESTLYVNLEPCAHFGKTPPCSDLIIEKQIPNVVIGTIDPFAKVAGRGIEKLRNAGCNVIVDVLKEKCIELNRRFFTFHKERRPYIILKWAETSDGFVDFERTTTDFGMPTWITNEMARIAVHKQRSTEMAIFIGTETALHDNPSLTLRDWYGKQPLRIVADRNQRLHNELKLFDGSAETITITSEKYSGDRNCTNVIMQPNGNVIEKMLAYLYEKDVQSVIVEGGPTMLQSFIDANLWDETHRYIGQISFGKGIKAPTFNASHVKFDRFYNSELRIYRNERLLSE